MSREGFIMLRFSIYSLISASSLSFIKQSSSLSSLIYLVENQPYR